MVAKKAMVHRRRFLKIYSIKFCDIWQNFYFYRILNNENFKMEVEQTNFVTHLIITVQLYYQRVLDPSLPRTSNNHWRSRDKPFASRLRFTTCVFNVGFHVCHLPDSFQRIILVLSHVMIQQSCGASLYPLTEAQIRAKY